MDVSQGRPIIWKLVGQIVCIVVMYFNQGCTEVNSKREPKSQTEGKDGALVMDETNSETYNELEKILNSDQSVNVDLSVLDPANWNTQSQCERHLNGVRKVDVLSVGNTILVQNDNDLCKPGERLHFVVYDDKDVDLTKASKTILSFAKDGDRILYLSSTDIGNALEKLKNADPEGPAPTMSGVMNSVLEEKGVGYKAKNINVYTQTNQVCIET
jgi:hypothetical protein